MEQFRVNKAAQTGSQLIAPGIYLVVGTEGGVQLTAEGGAGGSYTLLDMEWAILQKSADVKELR